VSVRARVLFMGTPAFAVPSLRALLQHHDVVAVVTQPDRPVGRGGKLTPPPVKVVAEEAGVPVLQPKSLRRPELHAQLASYGADVFVVVAYGRILPPEVLAIPPKGCLNVHASLLPRWRGAAPIAAAIAAGDQETGVTIMLIGQGLDDGPILAMRAEPIRPDDTTATLSERLAHLGAELLIETLPRWLAGEITPQPQDERRATYAPMLRKEDGLLDFRLPAVVLERRCRAFTPWPGTYTYYKGHLLKVLRCRVLDEAAAKLDPRERRPGLVVQTAEGPAVVTGEGLLLLEQVQLEGKRPVSGVDFTRGYRDFVGSVLGESAGT
jgi:methionyl-tRNA formyltransferase